MTMPGRNRWPSAVSLALNPSALMGVLLVVVAFTLEPVATRRLAAAVIGLASAALVPIGALFVLHARGLLSDVEMRVRAERERVYAVCAASYAAGAAALLALGAVWPLWGLLALHVPATGILVLLNRRSKVSIHTAVITGLCAAAVILYGPRAIPLVALIPCAGWARWAAGAHTVPELVTGAAVGGVWTTGGMLVLRALLG